MKVTSIFFVAAPTVSLNFRTALSAILPSAQNPPTTIFLLSSVPYKRLFSSIVMPDGASSKSVAFIIVS